MNTDPPLTVTHDTIRLFEALKAQIAVNQELQKQLILAADMINKLTNDLKEK